MFFFIIAIACKELIFFLSETPQYIVIDGDRKTALRNLPQYIRLDGTSLQVTEQQTPYKVAELFENSKETYDLGRLGKVSKKALLSFYLNNLKMLSGADVVKFVYNECLQSDQRILIEEAFFDAGLPLQQMIPRALLVLSRYASGTDDSGNYLVVSVRPRNTTICLFSAENEIRRHFCDSIDFGDSDIEQIIKQQIKKTVSDRLQIPHKFSRDEEGSGVVCDINDSFKEICNRIKIKDIGEYRMDAIYLRNGDGEKVSKIDDVRFDLNAMRTEICAALAKIDLSRVFDEIGKRKIAEHKILVEGKFGSLWPFNVTQSYLPKEIAHGYPFSKDIADAGIILCKKSNSKSQDLQALKEKINIFSRLDRELKDDKKFEHIDEDTVKDYEEKKKDLMSKIGENQECMADAKEFLVLRKDLLTKERKLKVEVERRKSGVHLLQKTLSEVGSASKKKKYREIKEKVELCQKWFDENKNNEKILYSDFFDRHLELRSEYAALKNRIAEEEKEKLEKEKLEKEEKTNTDDKGKNENIADENKKVDEKIESGKDEEEVVDNSEVKDGDDKDKNNYEQKAEPLAEDQKQENITDGEAKLGDKKDDGVKQDKKIPDLFKNDDIWDKKDGKSNSILGSNFQKMFENIMKGLKKDQQGVPSENAELFGNMEQKLGSLFENIKKDISEEGHIKEDNNKVDDGKDGSKGYQGKVNYAEVVEDGKENGSNRKDQNSEDYGRNAEKEGSFIKSEL